jgi:threonine/homoserine/homoserine lactone efflux protein
VLAYLLVAVAIIVVPGQDTALTVRNAAVGGRRNGVLTAAGVASAQVVWTIATAAGLAALLVAWEPGFVALRLVGAAYLVFLGATLLADALRRLPPHPKQTGGGSRSGGRAYRQGLLSNLGNPKMGVFFTSLLPQFGSSFATLLALGLVFALLTLAWLAAYAVVVARLGELLLASRVRRALDALTGVVLVALGLRLARTHGH